MKLNFYKFSRRLGLMPLTLLAGLILVPGSVSAQQSTAVFTGNITTPPQVDAINFYNSGTWNIITTAPYETANTLNYTNVGTMNGSLGWEFDWGPTVYGQRSMSASFFNDSRGVIEAADSYTFNPVDGFQYQASKLLVSATNVVNKGTLAAGAGGEIVLTGTNVNLTRSTVEIIPITATGSFNNFVQTNFTPDTAIYDEEWQQTNTFPDAKTPYAFDSSSIWDGALATSPVFYFNGLCLEGNAPHQLAFAASWADSTNMVASYTNIVYTNIDSSSNLVMISTNVPAHVFRQAVFIGTADPSIIPDDRFYPDSQNISNLFQAITVQLSSPGGTVYVEDTFGSLTNRGVLPNLNPNLGDNPESPCADPTFRPANYDVSRLDPGTFGAGSPGVGWPAADFLYEPDFSNSVVQADYSAYHAFVDNLVRDPVNAALTNLPGRIEINADNLDLTRATITSAGALISIKANNFIGSTGAVVSCENVSLNLGAAAGNVNVTNLVDNSPIPAIHGNLYAWSAEWTNGLMTVFTNWSEVTNTIGTNTVAGFTNNVITNITEMDFHVLMVDATALGSTVPVTIQDFTLQTNGILSDSMNVVDQFLVKGQSFTLNGSLNLSGTNLQNWSSALAPNLLYFTNNGTLTIPQDAFFGTDGTAYQAFVNNGTISVGGSENIDSLYYQGSGTENAPAGYFVTASTGKIENANITSGQDMNFTVGVLKLDHSTLSVGNQLTFDVTGSLYDSGGNSGNSITCGNGFSLPVKPATGDLLGTAITASAPDNEVDFVWAGEDRGATPAGYTNNVALGQLILSPQSPPAGLPNNNYFYFTGANTGNALYVDLLDLSQVTNLEQMLATDPNLVIYYAAAKLPSRITVLDSNGNPQDEVETNNPLNGQSYYVVANGGSGQIPLEPEEVLNGKLNGHLQWVSGFAGPNSSVDVIINGQTYSVNRALRYSLAIDSNGNGIPNGVDANPFNTAPLVVTGAMAQTNAPAAGRFAITWFAQTNMPYQVQYATSLLSTNWLTLLNYTNTAPTNVTVTVWDTNAVSSQRFYRVSHP